MAVILRKDLYSPNDKKAELFSDFFADFDVHPVKDDLVRLTNEDAVKRSIKNLLLTDPGDRLFNNTLGSSLRSMLFEQSSPASEKIIENLIRNTIDNYEPRAKIIDVTVNADNEQHLVVATIVFSIINKQEPVILELILDRIR